MCVPMETLPRGCRPPRTRKRIVSFSYCLFGLTLEGQFECAPLQRLSHDVPVRQDPQMPEFLVQTEHRSGRSTVHDMQGCDRFFAPRNRFPPVDCRFHQGEGLIRYQRTVHLECPLLSYLQRSKSRSWRQRVGHKSIGRQLHFSTVDRFRPVPTRAARFRADKSCQSQLGVVHCSSQTNPLLQIRHIDATFERLQLPKRVKVHLVADV